MPPEIIKILGQHGPWALACGLLGWYHWKREQYWEASARLKDEKCGSLLDKTFEMLQQTNTALTEFRIMRQACEKGK